MIQHEPTEFMKLSSSIESLSKIEGFIVRFYGDKACVGGLYGNILIALSEGVTNAIVHGNKHDLKKTVYLSMQVLPTEVIFAIADEGKGFDFEAVPDPTLPENLEKPNGRGIFLMRNLADTISFEGKGSKVKLTFKYSNR